VPAGTALTVRTGDFTISTDGQVVSGLDVHGRVIVTGRDVIFKNSIVRGPTTTSCVNGAAIDLRSTGAIVQDVEVAPANPTACLDGVWANSGNTLLRMNIHGSVDGVKNNSNTLIQDNYIHDMTYFTSDPNQGGGPTHNDGVQSYPPGSGNVTLRHNNIDLASSQNPNAAWQTSSHDSLAENNKLDGGACTINIDAKPTGTLTGDRIRNNRFGRHSYYQCPILLSLQVVLAENSGNVWDDTGTPIPPPQVHD